MILIPLGLVVLKWDGELGAVIEASFPKNLSITPNFANQIFSMHFSGDLSESSDLIGLQILDKKVISQLLNFGQIKRSVALILHKYESSHNKEKKLVEISKEIKSDLNHGLKNLESLYKKQFSLK
ncbi:MAG: hypothetical protein ACUVXA_02755 [Candidatus Jordarchaeum sp.]|uniref:hypothetical protein n=1 Tax=Candidatus Jordarchaeum sp. TaxID=2823881 RepID=UPI00404B174E